MILANLASGYHRDLQLIKEDVLPAFEEIKTILKITTFMLSNVEVKKDLLEDTKYDFLFTVEEVNKLVLEGVPFRDAYKKVGMDVEEGNFKANRDINHTHEGTIGNLMLDEIEEKFNSNLKRIERVELSKLF